MGASLFQLGAAVVQLLVSLREALLCLLLLAFKGFQLGLIFLPALIQLFLGGFQLCQAVIDLLLAFFQLGAALF